MAQPSGVRPIELIIRCEEKLSTQQRRAIVRAKTRVEGEWGENFPFTWVTLIVEGRAALNLRDLPSTIVHRCDRIIVNGEVHKDRNGNFNPEANENPVVR